jgi:hypothetical protein
MPQRKTPPPRKWASNAERQHAYRTRHANTSVGEGEDASSTATNTAAAAVLSAAVDRVHEQNLVLVAEITRLRNELDRVTAGRWSRLEDELRVARGVIEVQRERLERLRVEWGSG